MTILLFAGGERELVFELATVAPFVRMATHERQSELLESDAMRDYLEAYCAKEDERKSYKACFFETLLSMPVVEYNKNI